MSHPITLLLGNLEVQVDYEVTRAERQTLEHPGCPAGISIVAVTIGGLVLEDPQSALSEAVLDRWAETIGEQLDWPGYDADDHSDEEHDRRRDEELADITD